MNKEQFKIGVAEKKESEWLIPFDDLDMNLPPYEETSDPNARREAIQQKQNEVATWLIEIPGCNWSVGFIDDSEKNVMVVKWWFTDQGFPVKWPEG